MGIEVDNLFKALDILMDERLKKVSFDTTEICVIVDASNSKNGKYKVSPNNGETKYDAYSESDEYTLGETVRVSIPNGDFSEKKFIEGKYVVDESISPITYVSPLNSVVDVTGNLLSETKQAATFGLIANGPKMQIPVWSADLAQDKAYQDMQANGIYNTIALTADFKTLMGNVDVRSGSYGLRLDVYVKLHSNSTKYILRSVYLDSSEMFGDPYNFMLESTQSKTFDLSALGMVDKMTLYFYQNNDFSYYDKKEQGVFTLEYDEDVATENLILSNVVISFGSDLSIIEDNTLSIYSKDNLSYNSTVDPATNEKEIGFLWYNKTEDNQYVGFSDGLVDYLRDSTTGEIVYVHHVDEAGNPIMIDAVDEDGEIIYIAKLDDKGKPITTKATVDGKEIEIPVMEPKKIQKVTPAIDHYDEIDYLQRADESNRLSAYLGQEGIPSDKEALKLAADIADTKILFTQLYNYISRDLIRNLRDYRARVENVSQITSLIDTLMKNPDEDANATNNLQAVFNLMVDARDKLYALYTNYLNYCYKKQNDLDTNWTKARQELLREYEAGKLTAEDYQLKLDKINKDAAPDESVMAWLGINSSGNPVSSGNRDEEYHKNYFDMICKYIETSTNDYTCIYDLINNFISDAEDAIDEYAQGCRGTHDTYKARLQKILKNIKDILKNEDEEDVEDSEKEAKELMSGNHEVMLDYWSKDSYVEYVPDDFTNDANRYSIYWYRYEPGYSDLNDRFKQTDWRRLTTKLDFGLAKSTDKDADEKVYNFGLPVDDNFVEKDGKIYWSNKSFNSTYLLTRLMSMAMETEKYQIILFYNHEMYQSEELVFTNLDPVVSEQTADATAALSIGHGEHSQEVFQSYDSTNYLKNAADANTVRTLQAKYEGELGGNEHLIGGQIYWYIPNSATMLWTDSNYLTSQGFYNDTEGNVDEKFHMTGYDCYYKEIGSELVDILDAEGQPTGATKVTAKATDLQFYYKIKNYFLQTSVRNSVICKVFINQEKYKYEANTWIKFNTFGTSGTDYTLAVYPINTQVSVYPSTETPLELDINLFDYNNNPVNISNVGMDITSNNAYNFKQSWLGPTIFKTSNVEIRQNEDGYIAGYRITYPGTLDKYYGVLNTQVTCPINMGTTAGESNEDESVTTKDIVLTSYYPLAYSLGDYYIEGATTVIYGSGGNNPVYYKDPYKIFAANTNKDLSTIMLDGDQKDEPRYSIKWSINYYKKDNKGAPTLIEEGTKEYSMCRNSMPIIENNSLKPCNMYVGDESGNPFCYCAVECKIADKSKHRYASGKVQPEKEWNYDTYWIQPIIIIQNRYPSAMLNSWDGGLTIDEKNGTILSTMVGAGRKTQHNTFEGVLMGDIGTGADMDLVGNKSDLGIYGFHDGAQSFGFNIDGTGFIGKSGRGRINFDGNSGTIASASRTQTHMDTRNPDNSATGIIMDLDDGFIDMLGGQTYTPTGPEWQELCVAQYKLKLAQCVEKNIIEQEIADKIQELAESENLVSEIQAEQSKLINAGKGQEFLKYHDYAINNSNYYHALGALQLELMRAEIEEKQYKALLAEMSYTKAQCKQLLDNKEISLEQYHKLLMKENFIENDMYNVYVQGTGGVPASEEAIGYSCGGHGHLYKTALIEELQDKLDENGDLVKDNEGNIVQEPVMVPTQSHIRLDVQSPYFYIISDQGKRLVNIGDNTPFDLSAYKARPNEPTPQDNQGYYFKTNNYMPSTLNLKGNGDIGSGMLIDLAGNKIDAYDFSIKGESTSDYPGSYFAINSSPTKFMDIYYLPDEELRTDGVDGQEDGEGIHLFEMGMKNGEEVYRLRSYDWNLNDKEDPHGMEIDFAAGSITIHPGWDICNMVNGQHVAAATKNQSIIINSNHTTHPFQIGPIVDSDKDLRRFRIGWDGSIITPNFNVDSSGYLFATRGTIGGWTINDNQLSANKTYLRSSEGNDVKAIQINENNFYVTNAGYMNAQSGAIGGWSISSERLGTDSVYLSQSGTVIKAGNAFSVSDAGVVTASNIQISGTDSSITGVTINTCSITSCTVTNSLTFGSALGGEGEGGGEGVAGYACTVGELDTSYYTYGFTTTPVVKSITYTYWNLLGVADWKIVSDISSSTEYVLKSSTRYKQTRKYQVVKADTIESKTEDGEDIEGTSDGTSGGGASGSFNPNVTGPSISI